jgi:uncharacterized protein YbaR (Trm112 family)
MCGIAGIVHVDSSHPVLPESIQKMCDAIAHRGPDGVGLKSPERQRCQDHCAYAKRLPEGEPDCFACSRLEVAEGMIHCGCGKAYPIIGGVPRFLPDYLQAELMGRKLLKLPKANETWF